MRDFVGGFAVGVLVTILTLLVLEMIASKWQP